MASNEPTCPCCGAPVAPMDLLIDEKQGIISYDGRSERFSPSRFRLLKALIDGYPNILTKEQCLEALSDPRGIKDAPGDKIVDIQICYLRKKADALGLAITTAWGIGYRLELRDDVRAQVLRERRFRESRKVRSAIDTADLSVVRMLQSQGYPLTEIARRLRMTFRAVSTAMDIIRDEDERSRSKSRTAA